MVWKKIFLNVYLFIFFLLVWKICKQKYVRNKDFLFASLKNEALNRNIRIEIRTEVIPRFHKEFYDAKGKLFCYYLGPRYWKDFTQLCLKATLFWAAALRNFDFLTRYGDFDAWHFFNTDLGSKVINAKYSVDIYVVVYYRNQDWVSGTKTTVKSVLELKHFFPETLFLQFFSCSLMLWDMSI